MYFNVSAIPGSRKGQKKVASSAFVGQMFFAG
jgi:hypothetical protein